MKILLADPVHESLQQIAVMLSGMSYRPFIAKDGMEAWEIFRDQKINILITKWRLPRVSGLELCRKIRSRDNEEYTYIIIIVDRNDNTSLKEIFDSGADDYIITPPNRHLLNARIRSGERFAQFGQKNKELLDTLTASRNKLRIVIDALPEEIIATDLKGKIVSLNRAYVENRNGKFTDLWQQQIQAEELYFMEKLDRSIFKTSFKSVIDTGKPVTINDLAIEQGGRQRRKQIQFLPVKNNKNRMIQVIIVVRDTTEEDDDIHIDR